MEEDRNPLLSHFAREVKRLRLKRGWTQEALGKRMGFSNEMVSKVERGENPPSPDFAKALDSSAFPELEGKFTQILEDAEEWQFQRWADAELVASIIRMWQPLSIPGILQTEAYARAVHEVWQAVDGVPAIDAAIASRLERQSILDRPLPPALHVLIDESVLHRPIGGPEVMREQLAHLLELSERPRITIQIIPTGIGEHVGLAGAFAIASFTDGRPDTIYLESPDRGATSTNPVRVGRIAVAWDVLKSEALSPRASRDRIREAIETRCEP